MSARVATFLYHEVIDRPCMSGFEGKSAQAYKHTREEFRGFLGIVQASPVIPVLVGQVDFNSANKYLLLTFDDGGISNMHIADELERRGWFGHFFIPTAFIGSAHFMSSSDIRELYQRGHVIGSHSHNHRTPFYLLKDKEMNEEWRVSIDILSNIAQGAIDTGSIPGGEMDFRTQILARDSGLEYLFTSLPTLRPWAVGDMMALGRVCPKSGTRLQKIERLVNFKDYPYEMAKWTIKRAIRKAIVAGGNRKPVAPHEH